MYITLELNTSSFNSVELTFLMDACSFVMDEPFKMQGDTDSLLNFLFFHTITDLSLFL